MADCTVSCERDFASWRHALSRLPIEALLPRCNIEEESPMATNLVSLTMQYLNPDMIGRIAAALGLDRNKTQSAVGAAVPGLLAGFSHVAEQSDGAQRLAVAVRQESGSLGSFATLLGGGG